MDHPLDELLCFSSGFSGCNGVDGPAPFKKAEETKHKKFNYSVILSSNYEFLANFKNKKLFQHFKI